MADYYNNNNDDGEIYPQNRQQPGQTGYQQPGQTYSYQQPGQNIRVQQPGQQVYGYQQPGQPVMTGETKFCKFCGGKIPMDAVVCTLCGRQVEQLAQAQVQPQIIINNDNVNTNTNVSGGVRGREKNKWVAVLLCFFLGEFGIHRFYEGKIGTGILYLCTLGLFGVGVLVDFIILLCKPNPYYV